MADWEDERIRRLQEEIKRKEDFERKRLEEQERLQVRDRELQQELKQRQLDEIRRQQELTKRIQEDSKERLGGHYSGGGSGSSISSSTIITAILVLGLIGGGVYLYLTKPEVIKQAPTEAKNFLTDVISKAGPIFSKIIEPFDCLTNPEKCFSPDGGQTPLVKDNNVLKASFNLDPTLDENILYSITKISNNGEKDVEVTKIESMIYCEEVKDRYNTQQIKMVFNCDLPIMIKKGQTIFVIAKSSNEIPCGMECKHAVSKIGYPYDAVFTSDFTVASDENSKDSAPRNEKCSRGPIQIKVTYMPFEESFYYPGQWGEIAKSTNPSVIYTIENIGRGATTIKSILIKRESSRDPNKFSIPDGSCKCGGLDVTENTKTSVQKKIKEGEKITCNCPYKFISPPNSIPTSFLGGAKYLTITNILEIDYDYEVVEKQTFTQRISTESCSSSTTIPEGSGGGESRFG